MTASARTAMSRQVITRETTVAVERAAQIDDAIDIAHQRLLAAVSLPGALVAVQRGDAAFLQAALQRAIANGAISRASITVGDRVLAQSPADQPAIVVNGDDTQIRPLGGRDAGLMFSAPLRDASGATVGRLHEEVSLASLVPRLTEPLFGGRDVMSLVDADGRVLITASSHRRSNVQSPTLLKLIHQRTPDGIRYHSDQLGARIASIAPVPGFPWAVLVDADASAANAPAGSLVARLLVGFGVMVVLGGLVLWAATAVIVRGRRQLQSAHDRSLHDATTDPLTDAGNRRAFEARLATIRSSDATVGVVVVDIDGLKTINDTNGHAMGDFVIRSVSDAIHAAVRGHDAVFRIGGDEFAIIVDGMSAADVEQLSQRIVERISSETVSGRQLRASAGSAAGPGTSVDDVLHEADTAMYRAKRGTPSADLVLE